MNEWQNAEIINVSNKSDLALVKIDKTNTKYFDFSNNVKNGETVYTLGNPNGLGLSFSSGVVSSNERNILYNDKTITTIQTSLVVNEGNSGGPVFNSSSKLVGIISFRLKDKYDNVIQGVSFILPVSTIQMFIIESTVE